MERYKGVKEEKTKDAAVERKGEVVNVPGEEAKKGSEPAAKIESNV